MSILSESLTIGLLLTLVFGALFFYLYSRVSYSEKRVGLIENILIDIKMNQEQQPVYTLPNIPPSMSFNKVSFVPAQEEFREESREETVDTIEIKPKVEQVVENSTDEIYSEILDTVHASLDLSENNLPTGQEYPTKLLNLVENFEKQSVNYESMTKEELIELAKERGIRISNRPGREKLIQLIRSNELMAVSEE